MDIKIYTEKLSKRFPKEKIMTMVKRNIMLEKKAQDIYARAFLEDRRLLSRAIKNVVVEKQLLTQNESRELLEFVNTELGNGIYWDRAKREMESLLFSLSRRTFTEVIAEFDTRIDFPQEFIGNIRQYNSEVFQRFTENTRRVIRERINELKIEDATLTSVDDIVDNLLAKYDTREHVARTVARTSVSNTLGRTRQEAYSLLPEVIYKGWVTVGDARVRPVHMDQDGVAVKITEPFPDGSSFGGEPYNCRCVDIPLAEDEVRILTSGVRVIA